MNKPLIVSFDGGIASGKIYSKNGFRSFYSVAAPADNRPMESMRTLRSSTPLSLDFDLTIFYSSESQRWIVGQKARTMEGALWTARDMRRYSERNFFPYLCAALLAAHPDSYAVDNVVKRPGKKSGYVSQEIYLITSIAPGYFANHNDMTEKIKEICDYNNGCIEFIDNQTSRFYSFRIKKTRVLPEGYGSYVRKMWTLGPRNELVWRKQSLALKDKVVNVLDGGGRTTDRISFQAGDIMDGGYNSFDVGAWDHVDNIIDACVGNAPKAFPNKPERLAVLEAISNRGKQYFYLDAGKKRVNRGVLDKVPFDATSQGVEFEPVSIVGNRGNLYDITPYVDLVMRQAAQRISQIFDNDMQGGMNIGAILYTGGAMHVTHPYILDWQGVPLHAHEEWAGDPNNPVSMWSSNAIGAYTWAASAFHQDLDEKVIADLKAVLRK